MVTHLKREVTSLASLAELPMDGGSWLFVGNLMWGLSALEISELWMKDELNRRLNTALGVINEHSLRMARHFTRQRVDAVKARAFRRINAAVHPSLIGSHDIFWHYVAENQAAYRTDGCYFLPFSATWAKYCLNTELERDYARLVCGYALLIARKLASR